MGRIVLHSKSNYTDGDMVRPRECVWNWFHENKTGNIHIFEDSFMALHHDYNTEIKIAFLLESPRIYQLLNPLNNPYDYINRFHEEFDYIMSPFLFLKNLANDRFLYCPVGGSRINPTETGLYSKERLVSIVASDKNWTEGHQLRHEIVKKYSQVDTYGSGYNNIIDNFSKFGKIIAIAPYYFSLSVMNSVYDDYFTEIITDCFSVGTIPIWWGTKNIGKYFNPQGILQFSNLTELEIIMNELSPELYESKLEAVKENFELAKKYITHYDYVYDNYKKFFENL